MLVNLTSEFGLTINKEAAECLLCGLVTDTLGFRTSNTTAAVLATAQHLTNTFNIELSRIQDLALNRRSFNALKVWGFALTNLKRDGALVWTLITNAARAEHGYNGKGDADVINVLTSVTDASIFVTIAESEHHQVKVSWRARAGFDVSKIAVSFGGGGHVPAAGATLEGTLAEVETKIITATKKLLSPAS
jgi:phosphoesterase RecJ-like protein